MLLQHFVRAPWMQAYKHLWRWDRSCEQAQRQQQAPPPKQTCTASAATPGAVFFLSRACSHRVQSLAAGCSRTQVLCCSPATVPSEQAQDRPRPLLNSASTGTNVVPLKSYIAYYSNVPPDVRHAHLERCRQCCYCSYLIVFRKPRSCSCTVSICQ